MHREQPKRVPLRMTSSRKDTRPKHQFRSALPGRSRTHQRIGASVSDDDIFTMTKNTTPVASRHQAIALPSRRRSAAIARLPLPARAPTGGGERTRTVDLLLAKQALSQLSYTPGSLDRCREIRESPHRHPLPDERRQRVVGLGRLERPTSRLSGVRSNQLSYRPRGSNQPLPTGSQQTTAGRI